jgi:hypothetical protein
MKILSYEELDQLALDGCGTLGYKGGKIAQYDVAGYDRVPRREVPPASVRQLTGTPLVEKPAPAEAQFVNQPYLARIGGFRRVHLFGPNEIGRKFRAMKFVWNDGLGMGHYESLLIDRKFGLNHVFESPTFGYEMPFLDEEYGKFRQDYTVAVERMKARVQEMSAVYGEDLLKRPKGVAVIISRHTPLTLFSHALERDPEGIKNELASAIGQEMPPVSPKTPKERLVQNKFWGYIRAKHGRILKVMAEVLRSVLGSEIEEFLILGNYHELPYFDMEYFGSVYDYPAVATRPLLLEDDLMLKHYNAYWVQFFHDLTGKAPIVSLRVNLSAAGCRFVPDEHLIREWYNQAIRHGAGGFYKWPRDYPMDMSAPYDGPMTANPEPNTWPEKRWEASMASISMAATHKRFVPPAAEVGIFVPKSGALLHRQEWRRVFSAFTACAEEKIFTRFIFEPTILREGIPISVKVLLVPVLEFASEELQGVLAEFAARGGKIYLASEDILDGDAEQQVSLQGAEVFEDGLLEVFPLGGKGLPDRLAKAAEAMRKIVTEVGASDLGWVFDIGLSSLPKTDVTDLRPMDESIKFEHWMYEHGSNWLVPFINDD